MEAIVQNTPKKHPTERMRLVDRRVVYRDSYARNYNASFVKYALCELYLLQTNRLDIGI